MSIRGFRLRAPLAAWSVVLALGLILLEAPVAEANYLSTKWQWTYTSDSACTKNYNELSHNSTYPGGTYQAAVEVWLATLGVQCVDGTDAYPHQLRLRVWVWKASGTPGGKPGATGGGSWAVCKDTGTMESGPLFRWTYNLKFATIPCGYKYYTSDGYGTTYWTGAWRGGWVQLWKYSSQWYHALPAS